MMWRLRNLRMGRRAVMLLTLGTVWLLFAYAMVTGPGDREHFAQGNSSALSWADSRYWAILWGLSGGIAVVVGLRRHSVRDAIGYGALQAAALIWTGLNTYSFLISVITNGEYGRFTALTGALIWGVVSFLIRIIAESLHDEPWRGASVPPGPPSRTP